MAAIRAAGTGVSSARPARHDTARSHQLGALLLGVSLLGLLAGACGDDAEPVVDTGALTSTSGTSGEHAADGDDDHAALAFGEPAEPADATETVQVSMSDDLLYEPPSITVSVGDTVLFEVTNDGAVPHEFVLGDHELQLDHEQEMQEMDGMAGGMMQDEPNALAVAPGETEELAFTFTSAGELEYACHQPGHYDAGMIGTLVVEPSSSG